MPEKISLTGLLKGLRKNSSNKDNFLAILEVGKDEYCELCLGHMEKKGERFDPAVRGPISGWDVTTFKCEKCGHEHEKSISRD